MIDKKKHTAPICSALATDSYPFEVPLEFNQFFLFNWLQNRVVRSSTKRLVLQLETHYDSLLLALLFPHIPFRDLRDREREGG